MNKKAASRNNQLMTEILGSKVVDHANGKIGTLDNLVLSDDRTRIAHAIVGAGGVLGVGKKLFVFPWSLFETTENPGEYRLPVEPDFLHGAPGFDPEDWPDLARLAREAENTNFYGVEPFWSTRNSA